MLGYSSGLCDLSAPGHPETQFIGNRPLRSDDPCEERLSHGRHPHSDFDALHPGVVTTSSTPDAQAARRVGHARRPAHLALELVERRRRPGVPGIHQSPRFPASHRSRSSGRRICCRKSRRGGVGGDRRDRGPIPVAGWLSRRMGRGAAGRVIAGLVVAAALLLVTLVVVMPIAHLARVIAATRAILTQLVTIDVRALRRALGRVGRTSVFRIGGRPARG